MLDPKARRALVDFQSGRCGLEETARILLAVRRDTGCLELHAAADATEAQRRLVARYAELVETELGT